MDVDIAGQVIRLEQQQVVGLGGEGTVFLVTFGNQKRAVKVYHTPTPQRQEKLNAFLKQSWKLPQRKIALPLQVVRDAAQGNVIGLSMPYIDTGFEEIAQLANKKHRTAFLVSTRQITNIFLDGASSLACIHASGFVVGDFNDQNILYKQDTMLWIDVDAWQFSLYPCPVGTEDFLAPELYGIDLYVKPVFKPEHDWYSFAVHLFRSLLLAHPYGGTHKTALSLIQRAQQRLFVLHSDVKYPKMAYSPDLLSDELAQVFELVFARGWRGTFPLEVLREYQDSLVPCPTCTMHYPRSRRVCPLCSAKVLVTVPQPLVRSTDVSVTELLRTPGKFVFFKVEGETIHALAYEQGNAILYSKKPGLGLKRKELFKELPGAHYDLLGNVLIVNTFETTQLLFVDIFGDKPVALCQSETTVFAPWRKAVFQASRTHIYSIQNNALMWSNVEDGALSGRSLRSVMEKQTWFTVAQTTDDGKPTVFGFFQVFQQQMHWLIRGHALYDVALLPLLPGEVLIDIAAYFSNQSVLIRRSTRERGVDYLHTDLIDTSGKVVSTSSRIRQSDHPCPGLYGPVYGSGMLLYATDNGIVQEKVENGTFKTFSATHNAVQQGDALERYQAGLLILGESRVDYLVLN